MVVNSTVQVLEGQVTSVCVKGDREPEREGERQKDTERENEGTEGGTMEEEGGEGTREGGKAEFKATLESPESFTS